MNNVSDLAVENTGFVKIAAAISALGGLLFGYDTGVISGAILFVKQDFLLSTIAQEFVVSAVLLGAIIGVIFGGVWSDRFGRRKIIILAALIFTFGGIGTALASSVAWLIEGRMIVGIAIGVASFATPLYISREGCFTAGRWDQRCPWFGRTPNILN